MQRHSCRVSDTGEGIGIAVQASPSVFDPVVERLESQTPSCEPAVVLFQSIKPLQRSMISLDDKWFTEKVYLKSLDCEFDG